MATGAGRALLLFIDGVGIGYDDARTNPIAAARLPVLRELLGGRLPFLDDGGTFEIVVAQRAGVAAADATLGIPGLPQSGTGQTALLTGENAPAIFGRHFGPWVPTALRPMLQEHNLLSRAAAAQRRVAFANAYPTLKVRRPAAPPLAALGAGLENRGSASLREGRAVASGITNELWQAHLDRTVPTLHPEDAGERLAKIAATADVTLFAHYDTDTAGHLRDLETGVRAIEKVDRFLGGVLAVLPEDILLVIASDHGNLESTQHGHTLNPVPVIATGPGWQEFVSDIQAITDVTPRILERLDIDRSDGSNDENTRGPL